MALGSCGLGATVLTVLSPCQVLPSHPAWGSAGGCGWWPLITQLPTPAQGRVLKAAGKGKGQHLGTSEERDRTKRGLTLGSPCTQSWRLFVQEEFTEDWSLASQNNISPRGGSDVVWSDKIPLVAEEEMWQLCDPPAGAALQFGAGECQGCKGTGRALVSSLPWL